MDILVMIVVLGTLIFIGEKLNKFGPDKPACPPHEWKYDMLGRMYCDKCKLDANKSLKPD